MKVKYYYSLIVRWEAASPWSVQFGDYDRECVMEERQDSQYDDVAAWKVISTKEADGQAAINAKVTALNEVLAK